METDKDLGTLTLKIEADTKEFEAQIERCIAKMNNLLALVEKVNQSEMNL